MSRRILVLALPAVLAGCTSVHNPLVRADLFETQARGAAALAGNAAAYDRLQELQARWESRGAHGWRYRLAPWDHANRDRAAAVAAEVQRVTQARDAVVSQREQAEVMSNALRDLEDEYDSIIDTLEQSDTPATNLRVIADQKYLARRMAGSLVLMSGADMAPAVEAADQFGRDVNRFQQLLNASLNGDDDLGISPPDNPDVEDSLSQIDELFSGYVAESAPDVLEYVVARYDAWLALADIAALAPVSGSHAQQPAAAPAARGGAGAADAGEEAAGSDEGAGDDAGAADDGQDDTGEDNPADEGAAGDTSAEDEGAPDDAPPEDDAADPAI